VLKNQKMCVKNRMVLRNRIFLEKSFYRFYIFQVLRKMITQNQKRDESVKRTQDTVKDLRQNIVEQKNKMDNLELSAGRLTQLSKRLSSINQSIKSIQSKSSATSERSYNSYPFYYSISEF